MKPFTPADDATSSINVTTSSNSAPIRLQPTGAHQLRLFNLGPSVVFWALGPTGVTAAAAADIPLPVGAIEVITVPNTGASPLTHVAAIAQSGTATLYLTTGQGL